jgi:hypothetical protein
MLNFVNACWTISGGATILPIRSAATSQWYSSLPSTSVARPNDGAEELSRASAWSSISNGARACAIAMSL